VEIVTTPWAFRADAPLVHRPVIAGDHVVLTTARSVYALDPATGELAWQQRLPAAPASAAVVADGVVVLNVGAGDKYGGGADLLGLDAATGVPVWTQPGYGFTGTAATDADGRVLVAVRPGRVRAIQAGTGSGVWTTNLEEIERDRGEYSHIFSINTPAFAAEGRVFVHISTSVCYCLDARDGSIVWRAAHGSHYNSYSAAAMLDGVVYLGTGDGGIVTLSAESGTILGEGGPPWDDVHAAAGWVDPAERSPVIDSAMVISAGAVWFGARNGFLCRFRPGRGLALVDNLPARWGAPQPEPAGGLLLAVWPRGHVAAFADDRLWHGRIRRLATRPAVTGTMFCYGRGRTLLAHDLVTGQGPRGAFHPKPDT